MAQLTGTTGAAAATVNLTTEGTSDWIHWTGTPTGGTQRKSGGGSQLSDATKIGSATPGYNSAYAAPSLSWSDGTPTGTGSADQGVIYLNPTASPPTGWTLTAPADTGTRVLNVYWGVLNAAVGLVITATLSDGSAGPYSATETADGSYATQLTYAAGSAGQTLTVTVSAATDTAVLPILWGATLVSSGGGAAPPPQEQSPRPVFRWLRPSPRQTDAYPQLGVKTGTGLPDVQGRATPPMRRFPSPYFEALPPRVVVGAPPAVDSPTTPRRIYLALAPQQTEVPPQVGVATGTGLPDVQGAAVVPLRRFPGAPIDPLPPLAAAVVAPPPVDSPTVPRRLVLVSAAQSTDVPPQFGVKTGTGLPDVQGLVARAIRRIVQPLNDPAPPLPFKASPILDIQPVRRFMRLVRTVFTDLGSWLALPVLARLRPPFVAVVDSSATTVVPGAQQLTAVVDAQSLTVDGDT